MDRYEEALERARAGMPIDEVFPELKESEDERIRKYILRACKECIEANDRGLELSMDTTKKLAAYLKRQKEQSTLNFYVPEGADMNSAKNKIAVILGQYKSQGFIEDEEYYSMLKYIGEKEQKSEEWNKEDDALLKEIVSFFKDGTVKLQHDLDLYAGFLEKKFKSLRPQPKVDLDAIAKREYARGKQDGYWEGVMAERENCKTFHYESPSWPPKMPDLPTETTTNGCISSITPHWKPSEEQMNDLWRVATMNKVTCPTLSSLYNDLQKLL